MATMRGHEITQYLTTRGWVVVPLEDDGFYGDPQLRDPQGENIYDPYKAQEVQRKRDIEELCNELTGPLWEAADGVDGWILELLKLGKDYRHNEEEFGKYTFRTSQELADARRACVSTVVDRDNARADLNKLLDVIRGVHADHGDDLCWMGADDINRAAGLPVPDRRVGDKVAMFKNCERFVTQLCSGGGPWPSYKDLEEENARLRDELSELKVQFDVRERGAPG